MAIVMGLDQHRALMAIVMGLDQHRAQITAEWLDTSTGEVSRARIAPAHRSGVRRFVERFRGLELEVALEATTGWRFVVEELCRVGASVHLAEPAETAARRGSKKRAKNDRADARHLRELLMAGRLPESWIPPDHILDLRARVRLRHRLRAAFGVAAADPGGPVSPRLPAAPPADGRRWARVAGRAAAARERARAGDGRAGDGRCARGADRPAGPGAACVRAPAGGLPGADGALRDRSADRGHDPRRAGRLHALLVLPARGPLRRHGHHRAPIRSAPLAGASLAPGPAGAALGALRGRPGRQTSRQPRP